MEDSERHKRAMGVAQIEGSGDGPSGTHTLMEVSERRWPGKLVWQLEASAEAC